LKPAAPTLGSRQARVTIGGDNPNGVGTTTSLQSILLNPMIGETNLQNALSVRATRGLLDDTDGNSSLATSVTNSTFTSTVVTSTTRGDNASTINVRRILPDQEEEVSLMMMNSTPSRRGRSSIFNEEEEGSDPSPRSRSQSPLTVNTNASETISMASASTVGTSIRSSVAVAPRFVRRGSSHGHHNQHYHQHNNNNQHANMNSHRSASLANHNHQINTNSLAGSIISSSVVSESRPLADRVVSFTPDVTITNLPPVPSTQNSFHSVEPTDSITTMPDDLDNLSAEGIADTFANNARVWREEYEARLDALHKRWSNE